jgi:Major Facilitator Superfamily
MLGSALAVLVLAGAHRLLVLDTALAFAGFAGEMYRAPAAVVLSEAVSGPARVVAFSANRLAVTAGSTLGAAGGGVLAERSFGLLFVVDAVTSLIFGVIAALGLPQRPATSTSTFAHMGRGGWSRVLRDRGFLWFCLGTLISVVVVRQAWVGFPLQVRAAGFSPAVYGWLISLGAALALVFQLPVTALTGSRDPRWVIAAGGILVGTGMGINAWATTLPILISAVVAWTAGDLLANPVSNSYWASFASHGMEGRYAGAYSLTWALGGSIAGLVGGPLFAQSPDVLWLMCVILGVVSAVVILGWAHPRRFSSPVNAAGDDTSRSEDPAG